jgi:hypothetical protein
MIGSSGMSAQAAYVVDLTEVADPSQPLGFDVVGSGSGTIDLTDLTVQSFGASGHSEIVPTGADIITGATGPFSGYGTITGPTSFGSGGITAATTGSGDLVGVIQLGTEVLVPASYISGDTLSGTSKWDNATFASLGAIPGTYVWTWGTGAHADSLTFDIVAVPERSTWALMLLGFAGLGFVGYRQTRKAKPQAA